MASYVAFETAKHLMAGLNLCWKPDLFPEQVTMLKNGHVAVPADGFVQLEPVADSHGFAIHRAQGTPAGTAVPLANLAIGDGWMYHDPLHWHSNGHRRDGRLDHRPHSGTRYDPRAAQVDYIVGARTHEEAQRLLRALMAQLADGVEITPLLLQHGQPFTYFWLIAGHRPPLGVLQEAPRAWWGPAGDLTHACVFVQWPLSLNVSSATLQRIPWKAGKGFVLLSREEPERLVVTVAPDRMRTWPLDVFADVRPVETHHFAVSPESPNAQFPIDLKLRPRTDLDSVDARLEALHRELETRKRVVEDMTREQARLQEEANRASLTVPEPLLLFYGDGNQVPYDLRRLLIEWSNQPGDLDALRCARFTAINFPRGLDQTYETVHVVTTARVLGASAPASASNATRTAHDRTLPIRLQGHAPSEGAYPFFEQLEEWVPFGLHLFVPRQSVLRLHPRLPASPIAAEKLAQALFAKPVTRAEWERSLILLVQGDRDRLVACHIETQGFEPVAQVFDWRCTVNVNLGTRAIAAAAEAATTAFGDGLAHSLDAAVHAETGGVLDGKRLEMRQWMHNQSAILTQYEQDRAAVDERLQAVNDAWRDTETRLGSLTLEIAGIEHALSDLTTGLPRLVQGVTTVNTAATELEQQDAALERMRQDIERLRREIDQHRRRANRE